MPVAVLPYVRGVNAKGTPMTPRKAYWAGFWNGFKFALLHPLQNARHLMWKD